jgi:broad specificity phosphatase PhoE
VLYNENGSPEEVKMKLYVVRHGETEWNKEEIFRGRKDVPLNETGKNQAGKAGLHLADKSVSRILSSPLTRALQTAQAISSTTSVSVEKTEQFTDINFGVWEGLSLKEVEARFPAELAVWRGSPERLRLEGAETLAEVRERIRDGIKKIGPAETGSVVVATHRVICKMIVLSCLGIDNSHFWDMKFDPGSITLLVRKNDRFTLTFSNDTCHLREGLPPSAYRDF